MAPGICLPNLYKAFGKPHAPDKETHKTKIHATFCPVATRQRGEGGELCCSGPQHGEDSAGPLGKGRNVRDQPDQKALRPHSLRFLGQRQFVGAILSFLG